MMPTLSPRSQMFLRGVHFDLVRVVNLAVESEAFRVTEGVRTPERQAHLVKEGRSQTLNSRHLYGMAVDLCDPDGRYDADDMRMIAKAMKDAASQLGVPIVWGGDWKTFRDTPHFELDRRTYPDTGVNKVRVARPVDVAAGKGAAVGGTFGTGAGAAVAIAAPSVIESVPAPPDLSWLTGWTAAGDTLSGALGWIAANPLVAALCVAWAALMWGLPRIREMLS